MGDQHGSDDAPERFADDPAFAVHEGGKLEVRPTRSITSIADLALTYTPGVARVSSAIAADPPAGLPWWPRRAPRRPGPRPPVHLGAPGGRRRLRRHRRPGPRRHRP